MNDDPKLRYRCSCTVCSWRGRRTLSALGNKLPCPRCNSQRVYPDNHRVLDLIPEEE